jgi:hypothetical protein
LGCWERDGEGLLASLTNYGVVAAFVLTVLELC